MDTPPDLMDDDQLQAGMLFWVCAHAKMLLGLQVHLWTLARREGTPCVPIILAMHCNNENACAGLGDRIISLGSIFWLVRCAASGPIP